MQTVSSHGNPDELLALDVMPCARWEDGVPTLLDCLNPWLERDWQTQLMAGSGEPVYVPATEPGGFHQIVFAHGYFNSALHELAHWCLAGAGRRLQEDYGYWYYPDGRNAQQQAAFEQVEVKPQAIEWWLASATGRSFRTSTDNLSGIPTDDLPFRQTVQQQARRYLLTGLPTRAMQAVVCLCDRFGQPMPAASSFDKLPR